MSESPKFPGRLWHDGPYISYDYQFEPPPPTSCIVRCPKCEGPVQLTQWTTGAILHLLLRCRRCAAYHKTITHAPPKDLR